MQGEIRWHNVIFAQKHTQSQIRTTNGPLEAMPIRFIKRGHVWFINTPVIFGRMQWGWSQRGQAPGTAEGRHTQTASLIGVWPGLEQGPPQGQLKGAKGAPGGVGRGQGGGQGSAWQSKR